MARRCLVLSFVATFAGLSALTACGPEAATLEDPVPPGGNVGTDDGTGGDDGTDDGGEGHDGREGRDGGGGRDGDPVSFGVTSCQPAFEQACKPPIEFVNEDPDGRGKVFTDVIPDIEAAEQEIACTTCSILYRDPSEIPKDKHPKRIRIVLDTHGGVAQAGGDTIQFDLDYIATYQGKSPDVVKQEMLGVLQHETVHLYQNYGNTGTGEGLADLVRARMGYYQKSRWRAGEGTWKDPYTASGNFYSWLTGPCSFHGTFYPSHDLDFPYKLNMALAGKKGNAAYTTAAALIQSTFGESVDDLWSEYQATAF